MEIYLNLISFYQDKIHDKLTEEALIGRFCYLLIFLTFNL